MEIEGFPALISKGVSHFNTNARAHDRQPHRNHKGQDKGESRTEGRVLGG